VGRGGSYAAAPARSSKIAEQTSSNEAQIGGIGHGASPGVSPKRKIPPARDKSETKARDASDIWPKWTPSHRQYMDREQSVWQEQFDALNSRE